ASKTGHEPSRAFTREGPLLFTPGVNATEPITMASPRDDPDDSDLMDFEPPDDTDS
ncbi:unnamed protein product, partial [Pylaiella littoralis]